MLTKTSSLEISKKVASMLLEIQAIKLNETNPYTWASGWKSPIYCDNRKSLSYPEVRTYIKTALVDAVKDNYANADVIAGVATAGIPQGALIAEELGLPFVYIRSKPKGHGMENLIEGELKQGSKVVVVEDLISTGGSSIKAAKAIKEAGAEVLGMVAIFTYGFDLSLSNFEDAQISLVTLSDYSAMLEIAVESDYITANQVASLSAWRDNPANWGR